jgi:hypothetical protein
MWKKRDPRLSPMLCYIIEKHVLTSRTESHENVDLTIGGLLRPALPDQGQRRQLLNTIIVVFDVEESKSHLIMSL